MDEIFKNSQPYNKGRVENGRMSSAQSITNEDLIKYDKKKV